jgi:putative tryptophan/tyrosine transport system substrate-binding protein
MVCNQASEKGSRRNFVALLGVTMLWPLTARAQERALPVIGFLNSGSPRTFAKFLRAFQKGLSDQGFVEGRNVAIKYRWAEGHFDELDILAAELVADRVALIAATGGMRSALAARNATATIPIVFVLGSDPVQLRLAASLNKPGGNATGTTILTTELAPKRLGLLYELDPSIRNVAIVVNPASTTANDEIAETKVAAQSTKRPAPVVLKAGSISEIDAAFTSASEQQVRGLLLSADPLFMARREQLVGLAANRKMPTIYPFREFVEAGGLMSYGPSLGSAYYRTGVSAGRILAGAKPADLPVEAPARFEFVINLKTVKTLDLTVPPGLLAIVNDTIE